MSIKYSKSLILRIPALKLFSSYHFPPSTTTTTKKLKKNCISISNFKSKQASKHEALPPLLKQNQKEMSNYPREELYSRNLFGLSLQFKNPALEEVKGEILCSFPEFLQYLKTHSPYPSSIALIKGLEAKLLSRKATA